MQGAVEPGDGVRPDMPADPESRASNTPIRIIIADGQPIFRDGLRALLQNERNFHVIGEAQEGEAAITMAYRHKPDLLLLDLSLPRANGIEVLRQLSGSGLPVRVLVLTANIGKAEMIQVINLGARGVVLKSSPSPTLFEGIRRIMDGGYWIDQESVASLVEKVRDSSSKVVTSKSNFGLTPRELEIVIAVVSGYSNPEIAERLSLSEQTVKHHLTHIFDKLGVYSRVELALFAVNHKLNGTGS